MIRRLAPLLLLLFVAFPLTQITRARAIDVDPNDFLPSGSGILRTVEGDVDGDGRADLVTLYTLPIPGNAPPHASLLVLLAAGDAPQPVHLFGRPPNDLRGEPLVDLQGSNDLTLRDLTGDGRPEIVLTLVQRFQNPAPRQLVWVFGRGEVPPVRSGEGGPPPPPWTGTGFRLEAFAEGTQVDVSGPDDPGGGALHRQDGERALSGPSPLGLISETYRWRDDGFRLAKRALTLPSEADPGRAPETAVIGFYQALGRGDRDAAAGLLDDALRGAAPASPFADPAATFPDLRIEEARLIDTGRDQRARSTAGQTVYVRGSVPDATAGKPEQRRSFAGTWRVRPDGDRWRLVAANLHPTVDLARLADALPGGFNLLQTASGDVRGRGADDQAVLAIGPGRFALAEPYVLFAGDGGALEPAVRLASFVREGSPGSPAGQLQIADANGDGKPEITFNASVGAHSGLLWVVGWDGSTLVPLFEGISSTPVVSLVDLDDDGVSEIVLRQSGYCGSYAASPGLSFVFRWEGGAYHSASLQYPGVNEGLDEHASNVQGSFPNDPSWIGARACIEHMLATVNAFRGRAADARDAYRSYADLHAQTDESSPIFSRPIYLAEPYVEADLRAVVAAAESGQFAGWGPADLAILHDIIGDALDDRARNLAAEAKSDAERGRAAEAADARQHSDAARAASRQEYQAALALDPTDEEARRALGQ